MATWEPTKTVNQTRRLIYMHEKRPTLFNETDLDELKLHAQHHNLAFYPGDFSLAGAIKQAAGGFFEGFTTFDITEHPDNEYEAVIRDIGHLAGFAPGIASRPLKALGAKGLATKAAALNKRSVPMFGADLLTKQAKKVIKPALEAGRSGKSAATRAASDFLLSGPAQHIAEGAFHLGVASSISGWRASVDGGMEQFVNTFIGGASAGAVFRGLGNLVNSGNEVADRYIRTVAGSLFMGIPTTERGATTPEQVYNYLLGAYFGGGERPWYKAKTGKFMQKFEKKSQTDPELDVTKDPTLMEEWNGLDKIVQNEVHKEIKRIHFPKGGSPDQQRGQAYKLMEEFGILDKIPTDAEINTQGFKELRDIIKGKSVASKNAIPNETLSYGVSTGASSPKGKNRRSADESFAEIGVEYKVPIVHYTFSGEVAKIKAKGVKRELSPTELLEATEAVDVANRSLGHDIGKLNKYQRNLIYRNFHAVKHSTSIYGIGNLTKNMRGIEGTAAWAMQMAIDKKRPAHIYDQLARNWYQYDYKVNKFTPIEGTPKLRKYFLGVGDADINKHGKQAIRDLYETTFKIKTPEEPSIATPEKTTFESVSELQAEIDRIQAKNVEDPRIATLVKEQAKMLDLKQNEYLDRITGEIKEFDEVDTDIGMLVDKGIGKKSDQFIDKWFKKVIKKEATALDQNFKKLELASKLEDLIGMHLPNGQKGADVLVRDVERALDIKLPEAAQGELRQWITRAVQGKPIRFLKATPYEVKLTEREKPFTMSGKNKLILAPKTRLEEVFENAGGKEGQAGIFTILDHATIRNKKGFNEDIPLSRLELAFKKMFGKKAQEKLRIFYSQTFKTMFKKHGMYPYGGVGDNDRVMFAKFHPNSKKLYKPKTKDEKYWHKREKALFVKNYSGALTKKEAGELFDKAFDSNVTYMLDMNNLPLNKKGLDIYLDPKNHFIKDATALNKRNQIYFTNSWRASRGFLENYLDNTRTATNDLVDGQLNVILSKELPDGWKMPKNPKNSETPQSTDGGFIIRDDILNGMNKDGGYEASGQLKSFIVSPGKNNEGTLLTKKMFHAAGPGLSKEMRENKLHIIGYGSGAKQRGTRPLVDYSINNKNKLVYDKKGEFYVPVEDVRYNYSVKQGKELLNDKFIVKQAFMHLHQNAATEINPDIINDFFQETIGKRFLGTGEGKKIINDYLSDFNEAKIDKVLENFDIIGIPDILRAIKTNGAEALGERLYVKLLKIDKKALDNSFAEGEIDITKYEELNMDLEESFSDADRMITQSRIYAKNNPNANAFSIFDHKAVRGWREKSLQNAIIETATRPIIKNSLLMRMKPYDKWAIKGLDNPETKRLEKEDDIFFLDNDAKDKVMHTLIKGHEKTTLGKLWELYEGTPEKEFKTGSEINKEFNDWISEETYSPEAEAKTKGRITHIKREDIKGFNRLRSMKEYASFQTRKTGIPHRVVETFENGFGRYEFKALKQVGKKLNENIKTYLESIFRSLTLRVPLDSISGAQVLKFAGFTGRKGHGILLHGKKMEMEGGADLDGDEAFIYFGGKNPDGSGFGFKESWKDMFHKNRNEFIEDGELTSAKNDVMKKQFTLKASTMVKDRMESIPAMFSPQQRVFIAQEAAKSRNMLAPIISNSQVMKSAWNAISTNKSGGDSWTFARKEGEKWTNYQIEIVAKTTPDYTKLQRDLTRAETAYGADPLDELGLVSYETFHKKLYESYFEVKPIKKKVGKRWVKSDLEFEDLYTNELNGGTIGILKNINSSLFSKNFVENRKWNNDEINTKLGEVDRLLPGQMGTILPKVGKMFSGTDWTDNIFNRIDKKLMKRVYDQHDAWVKSKDSLKKILGRNTFRVPFTKYVENVWGGKEYGYNDLQNPTTLRLVARNRKLYTNALKGLKLYTNDKPRIKKSLKDIREREIILKEIVDMANNIIYEDMADMTTIQNAIESIERGKITSERVKLVHEKEGEVKKTSWIQARKRKDKGTYEVPETEAELKAQELQEIADDILYKVYGVKKFKPKGKMALGEERTAELDQAEIDQAIIDFKVKNNLNKHEVDLFETLFLGSLRRGNIAKIEELIATIPAHKWTKPLYDLIHFYRKKASDTGMSKLGFKSASISNKAIQNTLGKMNSLFSSAFRGPKPEETQEIVKDVEKEFNKFTPEREVDKKVEGTYVEDLSGYEGIYEGPISKEQARVVAELVENLNSVNPQAKNHLNEIVGYIVGKDLNVMTKRDFDVVNNFFKEAKKGTLGQRWERFIEGKTLPIQGVKERTWRQFPSTVTRELMRDDMVFLKKKGIVRGKGGIVKDNAIVRYPTHNSEILTEVIDTFMGKGTALGEQLVGDFREKILFLDNFGSEGDALYRIAVRKRSLGIMNTINNPLESEVTKRIKKETYIKEWESSKKKHNWDKLSQKTFKYTDVNGERVTKTGEEVVNDINEILTETSKNLHGKLTGDPKALEPFRIGFYDTLTETQPIINISKFTSYITRKLAKGEDVTQEFGVDGLRHIARSMMIELAEFKSQKKKYMNFVIQDTGQLPFDSYYPRMFHSRAEADKALRNAIETINNTPDAVMSKEEKAAEIDKISYRHKSITNEWEFTDVEQWDAFDADAHRASLKRIGVKKSEKKETIDWYNANQRMGSMFSRNSHIPGATSSPIAMESYIKQVANTYYRQLSQIMSRHVIENFKDRAKAAGWDKIKYENIPGAKYERSLMDRWVDYFKLYVQDSMGNPSIIPEDVYKDPGMHLKGTPYAWFADNRVLNRINKIADALEITDMDLPKEVRGYSFNDLKHWSSLEAKYELASLLSHPKTSTANIWTGEIMNIENVGFDSWRKSYDYNYLRRINPEWNSKDAVNKFVIQEGVMPEFILQEAQLNRDFKAANSQAFIKDVIKNSSAEGLDKLRIRDIAKRHHVTDSIINKAAIFMSKPEMMLRRHSFMAHYVRAYENFGGGITDPKHPFLIEQAKKGVKATQFLYNAPHRPGFARTSLGKVMTRFHLWGWNSVRFRNDIMREARIQGLTPGTATYDKFQRLATLDLLMVGLASAFQYSLFELALPAPWNWFQDTADWLFGNEKERDRAFFGAWPSQVAPLQIVTPPIMRVPLGAYKGWVTGDYEKLSDYILWSSFPFGRFARDLLHPESGLIRNPIRFPEKLTGLPVMQLQKSITKLKKEGASREILTPGGSLYE
tara:strand:- start:5653 stop:15180 length:9528 start_codon:yes stop_codon:yes gene_type:complete